MAMHQRIVFLLSMTTIAAFCNPVIAADPHSPVIPGFERFHTNDQKSDVDGGRLLVNELNCASCHADLKSLATIAPRSAPILTDVGSRIHRDYLTAFIANPHQTKPGTTMPDVLAELGEEEREEAATSLTHFLLSLKKPDFSMQAPDAVAAQHGERLFHSRGCVACHSPRDADGTELFRETSAPLGGLDKKYSVKSLVDFLRRPHASRPSGRMPELRLPGQELERIAELAAEAEAESEAEA